jgi:oligopeptide/dipeptide ABC transporter ATP-binding protein
MIVRLEKPTSGKIYFSGMNLLKLSRDQQRSIPSMMQVVFQNSAASLNPRKRVKDILSLPLRLNSSMSREEIDNRVLKLLEEVNLNPPGTFAERYPHELSGGERQRVSIARAISLSPQLMIADEPVSALDVSVKAQILNLFKDLRKKYTTAYLFITHDLTTVRSLCDRVAVMYLGKIVEFGDVSEVFTHPLHPYTVALLSATPIPNPDRNRSRERVILKGDVPSPINPPTGCRFHTRCPYAWDLCSNNEPQLKAVERTLVACHLYTKEKSESAKTAKV